MCAYPIGKVTDLVVSRLSQDPHAQLSTIADELSVHRHTLSRAIRHELGISFRVLRDRFLLNHICHLMCANKLLSLKEAALRLGYSSGEALSRHVKVMTGRSFKSFVDDCPVVELNPLPREGAPAPQRAPLKRH